MDLSIVSGTYNRIDYLKKMIASARASVPGGHFRFVGPQVNFVIVDAGSQDGTLEWLRQQPDVRLIEHGRLLGAVQAFNDGARAADGEYVILANDDIEFVGDAVWRAWRHMQDHPECGIGCFYQDRGGRRWHVEEMPVVFRGQQAHMPYGQVCILKKELGDRLGWWGDFLHTYGGDNELSSQCYVAGHQVCPLYFGEGKAQTQVTSEALIACIHDNEPRDALRKINNMQGANDPRAVRGGHPDSWAWGKKWRRFEGNRWLVGPDVREDPAFTMSHKRRERFLYLPIYERGWPVQKEQKRGLREALGRTGVVFEYDYVGAENLIPDLTRIVDSFGPTVCLFQLHGDDPIGPKIVNLLREGSDAWWVNWNGDYWPDNLLSERGIALAQAFDLQLSVNLSAVEKYRALGVNAEYWQIGWEPDGRGHEPVDRCDIVFLANGYSAERRRLVSQLRKLPSFRLWGNGWPEGWAVGQCTYDFVTACKAYRGARFSIGDSQWPDSGFVSNRVMQALVAGGSALCHQWFRGMEDLGLKDGETVISWTSFDDLREKLDWYSENEGDRRRIAEAGEKLALERHSFDARVQELLAMRPGEGWNDWR